MTIIKNVIRPSIRSFLLKHSSSLRFQAIHHPILHHTNTFLSGRKHIEINKFIVFKCIDKMANNIIKAVTNAKSNALRMNGKKQNIQCADSDKVQQRPKIDNKATSPACHLQNTIIDAWPFKTSEKCFARHRQTNRLPLIKNKPIQKKRGLILVDALYTSA